MGVMEHQSKSIKVPKVLVGVVVFVVVAGVAFYAGVQYQKGHAKSIASAAANGQPGDGFGGLGGGRRFGGGQRPTLGQVTSVSSSSITVQNSRSGSNSTFAITGGTTIINNGQTASASDIKSGDTVAVIANSSDSSQAARILINPSFGSGAGSSDSQNPPTMTQ